MAETLGRLLIDQALPPAMRGKYGRLDKGGIQKLFQTLADDHPEQYRDVAHKLYQIAGRSAFESGGYSPGLDDLIAPPEVEHARGALKTDVDNVINDTQLSQPARDAALLAAVKRHGPLIQSAIKEHTQDNAFTQQATSGAKGSISNVQSLLAGDMGYADARYRPIPIPAIRGFGEGVEPHEYFAGTFGARQGLVTLKKGTAVGGYFAKRLRHAAHRLVVTADDGENKFGTVRGLPVETNDPANEGALLASQFGKYPRDTVLTPHILGELRHAGVNNILVRSPAVGGPADGGVYGKDVGVRERGVVSPRGEYVGISAADAVAEPSTQSLICLGAGTKVRMADWSAKEIQDIQPGEWVMGSDLKGVISPTRVLARHDNGPRPCYETRTRKNTQRYDVSFVSTLSHKMLVCDGRVESPPVLRPIGDQPNKSLRVFMASPTGYRAGPGDPLEVSDAESYGFYHGHRVLTGHDVHLPAGICRWTDKAACEFFIGVQKALRRKSAKTIDLVCADDAYLGELGDMARCRFGVVGRVGRYLNLWSWKINVNGAMARFHELLEKQIDRAWPADRGAWIREQVDVGVQDTYDLEVDNNDHMFLLANGFISSNSSKHTGGVAGATKAQEGFPVLDRLVSIPHVFPGAATHARVDGIVSGVAPAPQGGTFVTVGDEHHYVPPELAVTAKPGQEIEAGDTLSDGVENPAENVKYRGIGEARRRFVSSFMSAAGNAGFKPHRRNVELLSRGLIDHVELGAESGPFVPGDIVPYTTYEAEHAPRKDAVSQAPHKSIGSYLESPVLHHTLGTRITKRIANEMKDYGVTDILTHPEKPAFTPIMVRSHDVPNHDPDWMARTLGSHLSEGLLHGVHRGDDSDVMGSSFVPQVAEGLSIGAGSVSRPPSLLKGVK